MKRNPLQPKRPYHVNYLEGFWLAYARDILKKVKKAVCGNVGSFTFKGRYSFIRGGFKTVSLCVILGLSWLQNVSGQAVRKIGCLLKLGLTSITKRTVDIIGELSLRTPSAVATGWLTARGMFLYGCRVRLKGYPSIDMLWRKYWGGRLRKVSLCIILMGIGLIIGLKISSFGSPRYDTANGQPRLPAPIAIVHISTKPLPKLQEPVYQPVSALEPVPVPEPVPAPQPVYTAPVVSTVIGCGSDPYMAQIYTHESGCSTTNTNSIGCVGLGQACPGSKLYAVCPTLDWNCENNFFVGYAIARYGSPAQAWAVWQSQRWW